VTVHQKNAANPATDLG